MFSSKKSKDKNVDDQQINDQKTGNNEPAGEQVSEDTSLPQDSTNQLNEKIKSLEKEIGEYKDRFLRKAAEFENYKRRVENDQVNLFKYAAESLITKLLPVIDDFERSLVHIKDAKDVESIGEGIKLVYDKMMKILADQGVVPIDSVGKPFDVHFHEAIMQMKAENVEPHTVVEEFEKGYMYKDRVIRHSKVAVSEDHQEEMKPDIQSNEESNNLKDESND
jgi:molecular chaperone GrpE